MAAVEPTAQRASLSATPLENFERSEALDTWGLKDRQIAHRGRLLYAHLDAIKPTIIFSHAPFSTIYTPVPDPILGQRWTDITVAMDQWASDNGYERLRIAAKRG